MRCIEDRCATLQLVSALLHSRTRIKGLVKVEWPRRRRRAKKRRALNTLLNLAQISRDYLKAFSIGLDLCTQLAACWLGESTNLLQVVGRFL